ncbi:transporter, LysE family [Aliarcobacter faecis]|uniref:LysE family translocator n=1 Tax=Aliarcobacter faecis TaxID=1564138 RepID=UPI00047DDA02|nr:LysE family translocator [Aliarcobacter faecis]QKF73222.1 transporter, LysE family [Aliarcobacter faecis]
MIELQTLIIFFFSSTLLAIIPGPDNIYLLSNSFYFGKKAGFSLILGLCSGLIFHTLLVIFGVALFIQSSQTAFFILKTIGAIYLFYLAFQIYKAPIFNQIEQKSIKINYKKLYLKGLFMNVTNPKVTLFFLAFLPQFVSKNSINQNLEMLILAFLFLVSTILVFSSIVLFASFLSKRLKSTQKFQTVLNKFVAVIFLLIAIKLFFSV